MKRIISISIVTLSMFTLTASASANSVTDNANILAQTEITQLTEKLDDICYTYDMDVSIYTEEFLSGVTAQDSADDIFDYGGYGTGENDDGILLYIATADRKYHLSTHARGRTVFGDYELMQIEDKIVPHLRNNDYYGAFCAYADIAEDLLEADMYGGMVTTSDIVMPFVIAFIAALVIAFVLTMVKLGMMKTAVSQTCANNYMKKDSMKMTSSRDFFIYSNVIKHAKPKNNSSGHISSSGRTHGGVGGSF